MTLRTLGTRFEWAMQRFGFAAIFGVFSGLSIGEFAGGEWLAGMTSASLAITAGLLWDHSRVIRAHRDQLESQRRAILSAFQDLCALRDELVARADQERRKG